MGEAKKCENCGRDIYEGTKCEDCKKNKRFFNRKAFFSLPFLLFGMREAYKKILK